MKFPTSFRVKYLTGIALIGSFLVICLPISSSHHLISRFWGMIDQRNYVQFDNFQSEHIPFSDKFRTALGSSSVDVAMLNGTKYALSTSMETSQVFITDLQSGLTKSISGEFISSPRISIWCDIDADGLPEALIPNWSENSSDFIILYFSDTNFSLDRWVSVDTGYRPRSLVCSDLDKNGYNDVVVVNNFSDTVSVFYNNSGELKSKIQLATEMEPGALYLWDWNKDGFLDITVSNRRSNSLIVFENNNQSGFSGSPVLRVPLVDTPKDHVIISSKRHPNIVVSANGENSTVQLVGISENNNIVTNQHIRVPGFPHSLSAKGSIENGYRLYIAGYPNWVSIIDVCGSQLVFKSSYWLGDLSKKNILYLDIIDGSTNELALALEGKNFLGSIKPYLSEVCVDN